MCRYTGLLKTVATMEYTANSVDDANKIIAVANIIRRLGLYDVALELLRQSLVIIGMCPSIASLLWMQEAISVVFS